MAVSRRRFVKALAAGAAVPAAGQLVPGALLPAAADGALPRWDPTGDGGRFALDQQMRTDTLPVPLRSGTTGPAEAGGGRRLTARADRVAPFTMLGVTLAGGPDDVWVRCRLADGWSPWLRLVPDAAHGPDAGEADRPASAPIWLGGATGYELSLAAGSGEVSLHLVRPTGRRATIVEPGAGTEASAGSGTEGGGYRVPSVRPRSAWGAAPYRGTVDTADGLRQAVLHHTVNGNGYSAGSVPAMLRSIQSYHQNTRGWDDIGYNFVIDRFATVWEGRAQSLYKPVIGAHAENVNTGSVGMAFLGDGGSASLSAAALDAAGRLFGWKLRLHNSRPTQRNIGGHRDVGQTSCPGNRVYGQLPTVRNRAIALQPPDGPFFDVPRTSAPAGYLTWGRLEGVIEPLPPGTFAPSVVGSRGDAIAWLWRFAGRPASTAPHGFTDVPADAHFRTAVRWGREKGIVTPTGDDRFRPGTAITRTQFVQWLWRYAGSPDPSVDSTYADAGGTMHDWAQAYRLVPGGTFGGSARLPRHEVVKLLHRMRRFDDVARTSAFSASATWAKYHVIVTGGATNRFRPGTAVGRRHAIGWLWRMMDRPASPAPPDHPFTDVPANAGYTPALDWAAEAGWVDTTPTTFAPAGNLTRGDAVTWLWRAAGRLEPTADTRYTDDPDDTGDLDKAIDWATEHDLIGGFPNNTFRPAATITRGQFARLMYRLAKAPAAWATTPPSTVLF